MDRRTFLVIGGALAALSLPAFSQDYPDHAVIIVQGYAPGGNADTGTVNLAPIATRSHNCRSVLEP